MEVDQAFGRGRELRLLPSYRFLIVAGLHSFDQQHHKHIFMKGLCLYFLPCSMHIWR